MLKYNMINEVIPRYAKPAHSALVKGELPWRGETFQNIRHSSGRTGGGPVRRSHRPMGNGKGTAFTQRVSNPLPLKSAFYDTARHSPVHAHVHTHTDRRGQPCRERQEPRPVRERVRVRASRSGTPPHSRLRRSRWGGIEPATFRVRAVDPLYLLS